MRQVSTLCQTMDGTAHTRDAGSAACLDSLFHVFKVSLSLCMKEGRRQETPFLSDQQSVCSPLDEAELLILEVLM